jgi:threonine/homoserine/homoserine lactone efflux protein
VISHIVLGITLGFAAAVQPGPYQTFLISRTLQDGWRHALPAAFAPLLSDAPAIVVALVLLTSLPAWMQDGLYLVGGCFVLFLAWSAFRSFRRYSLDRAALLQSGRQNFLRALALNLVNPNPYLFWGLVLGPLVLKGWRESAVYGVAMVSSFYATMVSVCAAIILLFAGLDRLFPKVNRILIGISVVALVAFGCYQLWLGITSIQSG